VKAIPHQDKGHSMRAILGTAFILTCFWNTPVLAAAQLRKEKSPLPQATQQAMNRGLSAAKQKEWALAIRYFSEARRKSPQTPKIIYYLALAHANAGGHELTAIAWFRAYLSVAPNSPVIAKVRKQILDLEIKSEGRALKLLHMAVRSARTLKSKWSRQSQLSAISGIMARLGDLTSAKAVAKESKSQGAWLAIALEQAQAGDWVGAESTLGKVKESTSRSYTQSKFVKIKTETGDIKGAQELAAKITYDKAKVDAYLQIARTQLKKGNKAETLSTLGRCIAVAGTIKDPSEKYYEILKIQIKIGELDRAMKLAARITSKNSRSWAYWHIAGKKLADHDWKDALRIAKLSPSNDLLWPGLYGKIVSEQIKVGDLDGARQTAKRISEKDKDGEKSKAYFNLAEAYLKTNDKPSATNFLKKSEELGSQKAKYTIPIGYVECGQLWLKIGDRREAQRSLERARTAINGIKDDFWKDHSLRKILDLELRLGNLTGALEIAKVIKAGYNRDNAYREIATLHAKTGNFPLAVELAANIDASYSRSNTFSRIIAQQMLAGKADAAMKTAAKLTGESERNYAYATIVHAQIQNGYLTAARKTTALITKKDKKNSHLLRDVSTGQIAVGNASGALETVLTIPDNKIRTGGLKYLAIAQAEDGDFTGAAKTAAMITSSYYRSWAQNSIVNGLVKAHQISEAISTAKSISFPAWRSDAWRTIASSLLHLGDHQRTKQATDQAASSARLDNGYENRGNKLSALARSHHLISSLDKQRKLLTEAARAFSRMTSAEPARGRFGMLATDWLTLGDRLRAEQALELKLCTVPRINKYWRQATYINIAEALARMGNLWGASEVVEKLPERERPRAYMKIGGVLTDLGDIELLKEFPDTLKPALRISMHLATARTQLKSVDKSGALRSVALARKVGTEIPEQKNIIDNLLKNLAEIQAQAGETKAALKDLNLISAPATRLEAIKSVAKYLLEAKQTKNARRLLTKAVTMVPASENRRKKMGHYKNLAELFKKAGDRRGAARLAAQAGKVLEEGKRENDSQLDDLRLMLVQIQVAASDFSRARKTLKIIRQVDNRIRAIKAISEGLGEKGNLPEALKLIQTMYRQSERDASLKAIASKLIAAGKTKKAIKLTESINEAMRSEVLGKIAARQAQAGDIDAAAKTHAMKKTVAGCAMNYDPLSLARADRAYHLNSLKKYPEAIKLTSSITDQELRARVARTILDSRAMEDDQAGMLKAAALLPKGDLRIPLAKISLVEAQLKLGQVKTAVAIALQITDKTCRTSALLAVVFKKIRIEDIKEAKALATKMPDEVSRIRVLLAVAQGYLKTDRPESCNKLLQSATAAIANLDSDFARARCLTAVAKLYGSAGDKDTSNKTMQLAVKAAGMVTADPAKAWAQRIVAGDFGEKATGKKPPSTNKLQPHEELKAWIKFIDQHLKADLHRDLPGFLQSIKGKSSTDMVKAIAGGGRSIVDAMKQMEKLEKELAAKRQPFTVKPE
jgi:tetratricopeptide (TPR) repeat protein